MARLYIIYLDFLLVWLCVMVTLTNGTEKKYYKSREENQCKADGIGYTGIIKKLKCNARRAGKLCENDKFCGKDERCLCNDKCEEFRCKFYTATTPTLQASTNSRLCRLGCVNGGTCQIQNGTETCKCHTTHTGNLCETSRKKEFCGHPNPCKNGYCDPTNEVCDCPSNFTGKFCETPVCTPPCSSNGSKCTLLSNNQTGCRCEKLGFDGPDCKKDINECLQHKGICGQHGVCNNTIGAYICLCKPGYQGKHCEIRKTFCAKDTCFNGGTCVEETSSYKCYCLSPYTGRRCNETRTSCPTNYCLNRGQCELVQGKFICNCPTGFTGSKCGDKIVNKCLDNPCKNGGTCENMGDWYQCTCLQNWEGQNCTNKKDFCKGVNCNNGTCLNAADNFHCNCFGGFTGQSCEININECKNHTCVHGECLDGVNQFKCLCDDGYAGSNCTEPVDKCPFDCGKTGCQQECNTKACNYDNGACTLGMLNPWVNCTKPTCEKTFGNGVCDPDCNVEECFYDGQDCFSETKCKWESFCRQHYNNSNCEKSCNTVGCAFDNLDCSKNEIDKRVPGNLVFIVASTKDNFLKRKVEFERDVSKLLRSNVVVEKVELVNSSRTRRSVDQKQPKLRVTTTINNKMCTGGCFSTTADAASFLAAKASKGQLDLPVPVLAVRGTKGPSAKDSSKTHLSPLWIGLIVVAAPCLLIVTVVAGKRTYGALWAPEGHRQHRANGMRREPGVGQEGEELTSLKKECESSSSESSSPSQERQSKRFKHDFVQSLGGDWMQHTPLRDAATDSSEASLQSPREILTVENGRLESALHVAARLNKPEMARQLIDEYGLDVNVKDKDGKSPLHLAVQFLSENIFQLLIRNRSCQIDSQCNYGMTALMEACRSCANFMVVDLVSTGAKVNIADRQGYTALHHAAIVDNPKSASLLLKNGAKVDAQSVKGATPLFLAAREGCYKTAVVLLSNFANRSCADAADVTPLAIADQNGHLDITKLLSNYNSHSYASTPSPTNSPPPSLSPNYSDIRPKIVTKAPLCNFDQKQSNKRKKKPSSRKERRGTSGPDGGHPGFTYPMSTQSYPTPPHRTSVEQPSLPELKNVFEDIYSIEDCMQNMPSNNWQPMPNSISNCMGNSFVPTTINYEVNFPGEDPSQMFTTELSHPLNLNDVLDHPFPTPPSVNEVDSPYSELAINGPSPFLTPSPDSYATTSPESGGSIC
ncbi:neurogenic locus notch homolog protein 1-like isoform X2 [Hydractinia symbiolongicarpus]|uniref:neurogenic locus notch homolog protein 1-like isoform X2 n=1 Tax=Hydractinia symbiolongicarpus TaxID=13093 RepID=UPI00255195EE|nr:neurogenic locus notch homolog protein 1-like isoform X2 [Hydractinia symbiolongicarpus]